MPCAPEGATGTQLDEEEDIPGDRTVNNQRCENLKVHICQICFKYFWMYQMFNKVIMRNIEGKIFTVLINLALYCEDVLGNGSIAPPFLNSALDGGEWSRPGSFNPGERAPGNRWIGGWKLRIREKS
jgi:hypothetical protein